MATPRVQIRSPGLGGQSHLALCLTVHHTRINDDARTICGWPCLGKHEDVDSLDGIPAQLSCERCLPTERVLLTLHAIEHDELSGDE